MPGRCARATLAGILIAGLVLAAALPAGAHDNYRIIGVILEVRETTRIVVKQTRDGREFAMRMDRATVVKRDKQKMAVADLRAGMHVIVDASGDTIDDLLVSDVRIMPPPAKR